MIRFYFSINFEIYESAEQRCSGTSHKNLQHFGIYLHIRVSYIDETQQLKWSYIVETQLFKLITTFSSYWCRLIVLKVRCYLVGFYIQQSLNLLGEENLNLYQLPVSIVVCSLGPSLMHVHLCSSRAQKIDSLAPFLDFGCCGMTWFFSLPSVGCWSTCCIKCLPCRR